MRLVGWIVIWICWPLASVWAEGPRKLPAGDERELWKLVNACADNSLYLYTRLWDSQVSLDTIRNTLEVGPQGARLEDLRVLANQSGVPSRAMKVDAEQLDFVQAPFIAHMNGTMRNTGAAGHYVVVTKVSDEHVSYLDGTTTEVVKLPRIEFAHFFSGAILEAHPGRFRLEWCVALALLGIFAYWRLKR